MTRPWRDHEYDVVLTYRGHVGPAWVVDPELWIRSWRLGAGVAGLRRYRGHHGDDLVVDGSHVIDVRIDGAAVVVDYGAIFVRQVTVAVDDAAMGNAVVAAVISMGCELGEAFVSLQAEEQTQAGVIALAADKAVFGIATWVAQGKHSIQFVKGA